MNAAVPLRLCLSAIALMVGFTNAVGSDAVSLTRTTVVVADKDASLRFYRDLLGFRMVHEGPYSGTTFRSIFDLQPDDPVYFVILRSPNEDSAMLGLLEIGGDQVVTRTPASSNVPTHGQSLLWMTTRDLTAVHTALREGGARIIRDPFDTSGGREMLVADPDGVVMYIFEPESDSES